ncbi:MAG: hypothetical protein HY509_05945 [Acidobacteria bacterium]|nr:hypothetical protein [Acidobacteriota bacterium]
MAPRSVPVWLALAAMTMGLAGCARPGTLSVRTRVIDLGPMRIDRIYRSMQGPHDRVRFDWSDVEWLTGFRTEVLDVATSQPLGEEFFCHSQLQLDNGTRLLVNATGIADISFPEGFALPLRQILSSLPEEQRAVSLFGMVLNNHEEGIDRLAKVRIHLDYLSASDLRGRDPLRNLYKLELPITVEAEGDHHGHGAGTPLVGEYPSHWVVAPGRDVRRRRFQGVVPADSTVHFGVVHLHNYAVYMRLIDLTEERVLWQTDVTNSPDRVQIRRIPPYRSAEGFPLFRDHEYEVEALYDNTGTRPVDAMASMYLFYNPGGNLEITYPEPPPGAGS